MGLAAELERYAMPEPLRETILQSGFPTLEGAQILHLRESINDWAKGVITDLIGRAEVLQERDKERDKLLRRAKSELEAGMLRELALRNELRAATELRGQHESKRITELEKQVLALGAQLATANQNNAQQAQALQQLRNESEVRQSTVTALERDLQQVMTAQVASNTKVREDRAQLEQTILIACKHLTDARDNIDDRWGKKPPAFVGAIRDDIVRALTHLPPVA